MTYKDTHYLLKYIFSSSERKLHCNLKDVNMAYFRPILRQLRLILSVKICSRTIEAAFSSARVIDLSSTFRST